MKKLLPLVLVVAIIALVAVMGLKLFKKPGETPTSTGVQKTEEKGVLDSIKDAISKSVSFKCDYSVGEVKSTVWVKGKAIYSETESKGQKNFSILKDDKLWSWTDKDKNGVYMDLSKTASDKTQPGGYKNTEQTVKELEEFKQNCSPTVVADSMFTPPTSIQFQDLGALMQKFGQ